MKSINVSLSVLSILAAIGCGNETHSESSAPQPSASASSATPSGSSAIEEALADAETGRDPTAARARLEGILADPATDRDDRGRVSLALSRLVDKLGDKDRAVSLAEDAVVAGNKDGERQLATLLTGKALPSPWARRGNVAVSDSARALAKYFPAAVPGRTIEIDFVQLGGLDRDETSSATFDVGAALRERAVQACGLCEAVETSIHTTHSREPFWTAMPRYASRFDKALVVVYVDEQTMPPERYATWLALPIADIQSALSRGEGLFAVKERASAPPLVTIAAPRASQLKTVEAKFAETQTFTAKPVTVNLPAGLSRDEIQAGVRSRFSAFRSCYEALTARKPNAAGRLDFAYAVDGSGKPHDVTVDRPASLDDAEFGSCMKKAVESIAYPLWSQDPTASTTVRYPLTLGS